MLRCTRGLLPAHGRLHALLRHVDCSHNNNNSCSNQAIRQVRTVLLTRFLPLPICMHFVSDAGVFRTGFIASTFFNPSLAEVGLHRFAQP